MLRTYDGRPITTVRHRSAPTPEGCRWCGFGQREHARGWVPSHGWHEWETPTKAQTRARMRVRFAARHEEERTDVR